MTTYGANKVAVLKRYPKAFSFQLSLNWVIYNPHSKIRGATVIGTGNSASLAWKDAARKLK